MLLLARKVNESILIGDHIEVMIVRLKCGRVSVGIIAPPDVTVLRKELRHDRTEEAHQQ